jgi:hypothetical protein
LTSDLFEWAVRCMRSAHLYPALSFTLSSVFAAAENRERV